MTYLVAVLGLVASWIGGAPWPLLVVAVLGLVASGFLASSRYVVLVVLPIVALVGAIGMFGILAGLLFAVAIMVEAGARLPWQAAWGLVVLLPLLALWFSPWQATIFASDIAMRAQVLVVAATLLVWLSVPARSDPQAS